MTDVTHFSLLPCRACQAPAGWAVYPDPENEGGKILRCLVCGREVKGETLTAVVEGWNGEFVAAMRAMQQEAARRQTLGAMSAIERGAAGKILHP